MYSRCEDHDVFLSAGLELAHKLAELEEVRTYLQIHLEATL